MASVDVAMPTQANVTTGAGFEAPMPTANIIYVSRTRDEFEAAMRAWSARFTLPQYHLTDAMVAALAPDAPLLTMDVATDGACIYGVCYTLADGRVVHGFLNFKHDDNFDTAQWPCSPQAATAAAAHVPSDWPTPTISSSVDEGTYKTIESAIGEFGDDASAPNPFAIYPHAIAVNLLESFGLF